MSELSVQPGRHTQDRNEPVALAAPVPRRKPSPRQGSAESARSFQSRPIAGVLFRVHEALLGRPTFKLARQLDRSQWLAPAAIRSIQLGKLARLVEHARARCPYYATSPCYARRDIRAFDDLLRLPVLTRDELRRSVFKMRWPGMPRKRMLHWTRGSSDDPAPFFWDRLRQSWDKANRIRGFSWQGLTVGDRELHLWPVDPPTTPSSRLRERLRGWRDRLLGDCQFDSLRLAPYLIDRVWRAWRAFNPVVVTAFPSVLCELIQRTTGLRMSSLSPSLRRIHVTGEVLHAWQRSLIEQSFGVPVFESYGVQEAGALAFECEHGEWHLSDESLIVELIRGDGRPARPGEIGEVVVTGLDSFAMPLIRYATGDIGRATDRRCRCGRGLSVLEPLLGRKRDFLRSDVNRWVGPREVVETLAGVVENGGFQVVQQPDGLVAVETLPGACAAGPDAVIQRLRGILGQRTVSFQTVPRLDRTAFGKCRYVRSG